MGILFFFLDGVGLGANNPAINPFARANMPNLQNLLDGERLLSGIPQRSTRADLLALDACLGVPGLPQSASGQATLLTGQNIPAALGYHYGPKPNPPVAGFLHNGNLFNTLHHNGLRTAFLNAYPPRYFASIQSGRRLYSAIPLAASSAGIPLRTFEDLKTGQAIAADLTAEGWHTHLGLGETPLLSLHQAGVRLASLSQVNDFSLFEYWLSDYAGHGQDMDAACTLLEAFDLALGGLFDAWDDREGLILFTSDHGNLEDLSTRRHTTNPIPALLVGAVDLRDRFIRFAQLSASRRSVRAEKSGNRTEESTDIALDLTDVAPAILSFLGDQPITEMNSQQ